MFSSFLVFLFRVPRFPLLNEIKTQNKINKNTNRSLFFVGEISKDQVDSREFRSARNPGLLRGGHPTAVHTAFPLKGRLMPQKIVSEWLHHKCSIARGQITRGDIKKNVFWWSVLKFDPCGLRVDPETWKMGWTSGVWLPTCQPIRFHRISPVNPKRFPGLGFPSRMTFSLNLGCRTGTVAMGERLPQS